MRTFMSENTPQPTAPQQPQFTQQAPAVQPAYGTPVEAPKKKKWAAVTALVLGIISALTGIFVIGSFLTIPTIIFAVIALVMVKNGTGKGKGMAIAALVLVLVAYIATFAFFQIRAANLQKSEQQAREVIQKCENHEPGYYITEKDGKRYCNAGGWVYEMDK